MKNQNSFFFFNVDVQNRQFQESPNYLEIYSDQELINRFRLNKGAIKFIEELIKNSIQIEGNTGRPIDCLTQILITLRYLASNSHQSVIADTFNVSQATVSRSIENVLNGICEHIDEFIRFPREDEAKATQQEFYKIAGFLGLVGCIEGTHIRILAPHTNPTDFINRKNYYSINVQVICDEKLRITYLVAKCPGSAQDSWILQQSKVWDAFETGRFKGILLGDSAYPCKNWMMVPSRIVTQEHQPAFNRAQTRTRVLIEHCFGVWKRRFAILHGEMRLTHEKAAKAVTACAILQNIAVKRRIATPNPLELISDSQPSNEEFPGSGKENAFSYREAIARNSFTQPAQQIRKSATGAHSSSDLPRLQLPNWARDGTL